MNAHTDFRVNAGQAAIEYLGVVLAVALMLIGVAVVMPRLGDPRPGSGIDAIADQVALVELLGPAGTGDESWLGRAVRGVGRAGSAVVLGQVVLGARFVQALADDVRAVAANPVSAVVAAGHVGPGLGAVLRDPAATLRGQFDDLRDYVGRLRRMPPDEAYIALMGDTGALAEDLLIARGRSLALKRLARALEQARRRDRVARSARG